MGLFVTLKNAKAEKARKNALKIFLDTVEPFHNDITFKRGRFLRR